MIDLRDYPKAARGKARNVPASMTGIRTSSGSQFKCRVGVFDEKGTADQARQARERNTGPAALKQLKRMIKAGDLPLPDPAAESATLIYDPRWMTAGATELLSVAQLPESGTIVVFPPALETLERAVMSIGHELWRFNKSHGENADLAYLYAQRRKRVLFASSMAANIMAHNQSMSQYMKTSRLTSMKPF